VTRCSGLVAALILATAGCKGLPKNKAEISSSIWNYPFKEVVIETVDTQPVRPGGDKITIDPGLRAVTARIQVTADGPAPTGLVTFVAEGGHSYRVQGKCVGDDAVLWVTDRENRQVVGGKKP